MPDLKTIVAEIADAMRKRSDRGGVATYIPELAGVDPRQFGIAIASADGEVAAAGDCDRRFPFRASQRCSR